MTTSTVERLDLWGIVRAADVVRIAAEERLDLAAAATCLEKESFGGRNVWGSDGVQTGGTYVKGAVVTEAAYRAYRREQDAGRIGAQGVGPTQLTYPPLQRQADALGGCWVWEHNVRIGFRHLAQLIRAYGRPDGFRRYNGSGPRAEKYRADAEEKYAAWRTRLAGAATPPPNTARPPTAAPAPVTDWFDMATEADLRKILTEMIPQLVWHHPIPDWYQPNLPPQEAFAMLAWAAAHAAHARNGSSAASAAVETLRAELRTALNSRPGGSPAAPADVDDLVDAVLAALARTHLTLTPATATV